MTHIIAAAALTFVAPQGPAIDYGDDILYANEGVYRHIGWSNDETYFAFDTELNGAGALGIEQRIVLAGWSNNRKAMFRWQEDSPSGETWLDAQSADIMSELDITGTHTGHLIFQYPASYYLSNHRLKPWSQLKSRYAFTLDGETYTVHLENLWETSWTEEESYDDIAVRFNRAAADVFVEQPDGAVDQVGRIDYSDTPGYSISRIYLSPSRDRIAVVLARFTFSWFEGTNLQAEYDVVIDRYRY